MRFGAIINYNSAESVEIFEIRQWYNFLGGEGEDLFFFFFFFHHIEDAGHTAIKGVEDVVIYTLRIIVKAS